ncbi:MAG: GYD domain-containing protein [Devosia sp.]|nr:GYD domain-containing protein [Devosia sp.]
MKRFMTQGRFTQAWAKGMIAAPEDRGAAVRQLVEAAGAKLVEFYLTTGAHDFLMVIEADEIEPVMAVAMASGAAGTVADLTTFRAWTTAEFMPIARASAKATAAYRVPG